MKDREEQNRLCWKAFSALTTASLPHPPTNSQKLKLPNVTVAPDQNKNTTEKVPHKKIKFCK